LQEFGPAAQGEGMLDVDGRDANNDKSHQMFSKKASLKKYST
jgi:hypothetical protein